MLPYLSLEAIWLLKNSGAWLFSLEFTELLNASDKIRLSLASGERKDLLLTFLWTTRRISFMSFGNLLNFVILPW